MSTASLESRVLQPERVLWTRRTLAIRWSAEHSLVAHETSQGVSRSKPPTPTAPLDTQPRKTMSKSDWKANSCDMVIRSFYIYVFRFELIVSNRYTNSYNGNCIHIQMAWVQNHDLVICQGSLSSHPTFEKRHQSALAEQSCWSHLPAIQSQMATGKIHCQSLFLLSSWRMKRYLMSTWFPTWLNPIHTYEYLKS